MKKKSKRGDGRIVQKRCTRSKNIEWRSDMWRAGYPPSLTLPIRSRFLSLPPRSSSFFLFPLLSLSSRPLLSSPLHPSFGLFSRAHLHAPRVTYTQTRWRTLCPWYKLQVIAAREEGSLLLLLLRVRRKGGRAGPKSRERVKLRILWFTNVILYKGIWIWTGRERVKNRPCDLRGPTAR